MRIRQHKCGDGSGAYVETHVLNDELVRIIAEMSGTQSPKNVRKILEEGRPLFAGGFRWEQINETQTV